MHTAFHTLMQALRPAWAARHAAATSAACQWHAPCGALFTLRPSRTADAKLLGGLLDGGLSHGSRRNRFHGSVGRLSAERLAWLASGDGVGHAAFIVTRDSAGPTGGDTGGNARGDTLGDTHAVAEGRWVCTPGKAEAEFALCVADAWQGLGVGQRLLTALVQAARQRGLSALVGDVLSGNQAMQALAERLQFSCDDHPDDAGLLRATLVLRPPRRGVLASGAWLH